LVASVTAADVSAPHFQKSNTFMPEVKKSNILCRINIAQLNVTMRNP